MAGITNLLTLAKSMRIFCAQRFHEMWHFHIIISVCLLICQIPTLECDQNVGYCSINPRSSVNMLPGQNTSFELSEDVDTITVGVIHITLSDRHTYSRQLQFRSFGKSFKLFLRRHYLFHNGILLNVGDQDFGKLEVKKYLPVVYVGVSEKSLNSNVYGKITEEEFEIIIHELPNNTFSVQCPYGGTAFQSLKHSLYNCKAYKWNRPNISKLVNPVDNCDSQSKKYKDFLSKTMPMTTDFVNENDESKRLKRSAAVIGNCVLKLVADHLYFEHIGKGDIRKTIAEMSISLAEADQIFRQTDFDGDGVGDNIGFKVGNITIYSDFQNYNMKDENLDVYSFMDKLTEYDFSEYCLGVGYTARDFEDNIVGLAYVGSSNTNSAGGICHRRPPYRPDRNYYSYNTALITQLHNGYYLPSHSSALVLAHEFGHSFGSSHDVKTDPVCSPGENFGKYLMNPSTTSGTLANNRRFSPCSISSMYPVIVHKSPGCFQEDLGPFCGNNLVEDGEECDWCEDGLCFETDPCCTPNTEVSNTSDLPCSIRRSLGYQCSPKTSPCCTDACKYHDISSNLPQCREMTECSSASTCEVGRDTCPDSVPHPYGTTCDSGRKVCNQGRCSLSICRYLGFNDCQCSLKNTACYVCCVPKNNSVGCSPLSLYSSGLSDMLKHKGDACYNYNGFCDEAGQCILEETDTNDGLKKIFSEETVINLSVWFKKYWYYVVVGIILTTTLAIIVSVFFRPKQDEHIEAMRLGKLSAVLAQAERQKAAYTEKMDDCEVVFRNLIEQIKSQQCPMPLTQAVARLSVFFPTTPISLLMKSAQSSSSEEVAVKMLLVRDCPMQKFSMSLLDNEEKPSKVQNKMSRLETQSKVKQC